MVLSTREPVPAHYQGKTTIIICLDLMFIYTSCQHQACGRWVIIAAVMQALCCQELNEQQYNNVVFYSLVSI